MTWPYESASQISLPNDADTARILSPISKASYVGLVGDEDAVRAAVVAARELELKRDGLIEGDLVDLGGLRGLRGGALRPDDEGGGAGRRAGGGTAGAGRDGARGERDGRREGASGGGHDDQVDDGNGVLSTRAGCCVCHAASKRRLATLRGRRSLGKWMSFLGHTWADVLARDWSNHTRGCFSTIFAVVTISKRFRSR
jgi:hypothetical protein